MPVFKKSNPASFWKRLIAYIIDVAILSVVVSYPFRQIINNIINGKDFISTYDFFINNPEQLTKLILISIIIGVLYLIYWIILEYRLQQTIGKIIMNIQVVSETKSLTLSQVFLRNLTKVSTLLLVIDSLPLIFNKQKRIFDRLANTMVVEKNEKI